jgi:hypothetical protein
MSQFISFEWMCLKDAWLGCWTRANELAGLLGGGILWGVLWWLSPRLRESHMIDAPTTYWGAAGLTFFLAVFSVILSFFVIFLFRVITAAARLYHRSQDQVASLKQTLNDALKPTFKLSFHPEAEGFARTPIWVKSGDLPQTVNLNAMYARIRVEAISIMPITRCHAFLTKLEREAPFGEYASELPLPHGIGLKHGQPFDIYPNVVTTVDFVIFAVQTTSLESPKPIGRSLWQAYSQKREPIISR